MEIFDVSEPKSVAKKEEKRWPLYAFSILFGVIIGALALVSWYAIQMHITRYGTDLKLEKCQAENQQLAVFKSEFDQLKGLLRMLPNMTVYQNGTVDLEKVFNQIDYVTTKMTVFKAECSKNGRPGHGSSDSCNAKCCNHILSI